MSANIATIDPFNPILGTKWLILLFVFLILVGAFTLFYLWILVSSRYIYYYALFPVKLYFGCKPV